MSCCGCFIMSILIGQQGSFRKVMDLPKENTVGKIFYSTTCTLQVEKFNLLIIFLIEWKFIYLAIELGTENSKVHRFCVFWWTSTHKLVLLCNLCSCLCLWVTSRIKHLLLWIIDCNFFIIILAAICSETLFVSTFKHQ